MTSAQEYFEAFLSHPASTGVAELFAPRNYCSETVAPMVVEINNELLFVDHVIFTRERSTFFSIIGYSTTPELGTTKPAPVMGNNHPRFPTILNAKSFNNKNINSFVFLYPEQVVQSRPRNKRIKLE